MAKESIALKAEDNQAPDFTSNIPSMSGRLGILGDLGELDLTHLAILKSVEGDLNKMWETL